MRLFQMPDCQSSTFAAMTTEIVAAYIAWNSVQPGDMPGLIAAVHTTLADLDRPARLSSVAVKPVPAVKIRKTIKDEHIISLEDGKPYKTLKRHLAKLGLTPDAYRAKWGLPHDYPMVPAAQSRARSAMAKAMGLGTLRRRR